MSTSSAVSAGGVVQSRAGEMVDSKSLPRCRSGMGVRWTKAGLVRVKFLGACMSGRAQTSVWAPAWRLRSAKPMGFAGVALSFLYVRRMGSWGCEACLGPRLERWTPLRGVNSILLFPRAQPRAAVESLLRRHAFRSPAWALHLTLGELSASTTGVKQSGERLDLRVENPMDAPWS